VFATTIPPVTVSPNPPPTTDNSQNAMNLGDVPTVEKKKSKKRKHALTDDDGQVESAGLYDLLSLTIILGYPDEKRRAQEEKEKEPNG
jgi:hypothetical protein